MRMSKGISTLGDLGIEKKKIPTVKNIVISPDFLVWKFCIKAKFIFTQNFYTRKSGKITV